MKTRLCPLCLTELSPETIEWAAPDGSRSTARPPQVRRSLMGLGRKRNTAAEWAEWYTAGYRAHCPGGNCPLPQDYLERDQILIGLVGESGSSKTHYMTVLIKLLLDGALAPHSISVSLDPETAIRYQEFHRRLWDDLEVIPASKPLVWLNEKVGERQVRQPMTVVLRNWETGRALNLHLFDAAGEQLLTHQAQATWARHIAIADGLLFFVDPSVLGGLRKQLGTTGGGQAMFRTQSILDTTSTLVRRARSMSPDDDLQGLAVGLVLAKADLVADVPDFPSQVLRERRGEPSTGSALSSQIDQDSVAVSRFLERCGGINLVAAASHLFPRLSFHAVSTTGCSPVDGRYPSVEPRRCLDPLLAVLAAHGVVDLAP